MEKVFLKVDSSFVYKKRRNKKDKMKEKQKQFGKFSQKHIRIKNNNKVLTK